MMRLSARHEAIVSQVTPGAKVLDVGTDHGFVAIALVKRGIASYVCASDINEGPLWRAQENMELYGVDFPLYLADGIIDVPIDNIDTIIIAGMGGELIAEILSKRDLADRKLILCPHTKAHELRKSRIHIEKEVLVEDGGRLYPIICATQGDNGIENEADFYISPHLREDPLFPEWVQRELKKTDQILRFISRGTQADAAMKKQLWYKGELEKYANLRRDS